MKTPFFPSLRHVLAPMRSGLKAAAKGISQATLHQIEERFAPALEANNFQKPTRKDHSRERVFSLTRTFWCWTWQVLQGNTSCREVVRQVQALFALNSQGQVDEATGAYCRARKKLADPMLEGAFLSSARSAQKYAPAAGLLQGRCLKIVDGSYIRVPDTSANRKAYPPTKHQSKKPCFPMMKVVALFSAASGAILARAVGSFKQSEMRLLLGLKAEFSPEDVLTGDRHYGCFVMAAWLQTLGTDLIARLASGSRKVDFRKAFRRISKQDAVFKWCKPKKASSLLSAQEWEALPQEVLVRIIRTRLERPGIRTREITVVTTLLDEQLYPAQEILSAYYKRWRLEMCIDDLKTTLGMEMLHCLTPKLLKKELLVFLTVHNLLRWMMAQAAQCGGVNLERLSFKGSLDAFRQWSVGLVQVRGPGKKRKQAEMWHQLLRTLVADLVPLRPGRMEPRAVKKRSKYPPLNCPRRLYRGRLSRGARRSRAVARKNAA
jgi:hypothetical protein